MNLIDKYKKTLIRNNSPGNIYIDGKEIKKGDVVLTDINTAITMSQNYLYFHSNDPKKEHGNIEILL